MRKKSGEGILPMSVLVFMLIMLFLIIFQRAYRSGINDPVPEMGYCPFPDHIFAGYLFFVP